MPAPLQIDAGFSSGMRRDYDRAQMPNATAWNLVDWIPDELGAPLRGRGAWTYSGSTMTGATSFGGLIYAPFSTAKVLGVDQLGNVWDVVAASKLVATLAVPGLQNPFFHRGKVIFPSNDGSTGVSYYDGSTSGALAGSPPAGQLGCAWKDYSVLARSSANTNRVWFSAPGDPTTWDTTNGYWDTTGDVTALAPMRALILVMHKDSVERLRGTTPPPQGDFTLEKFMSSGCLDALSVVQWNDQVVFASAQGVYLTDGAAWVNLIDAGGMQTYWQSLMQSYASTYRFAAGVYQSHYILTITNGASFVDCLVCDLRRRSWWRFSNFPAGCFTSTFAGREELYAGLVSTGRVAKVSPCWNLPSSPVTQTDASGTGPRTVLETGFHRGWTRWHRKWIPGMGLQHWQWLYAGYDLRNGGATPTYTLSYTLSPETDASYTSLATLAATTGYDPPTAGRARTMLGFRANGVALKLLQNNDAADQRFYAFEADYGPIDTGSLR